LEMKRIAIFIVAACLLLGLLTGCKPQFQPGAYTDDAGRQVDITEIPEKIVSFGPAITEILFALGLGDKVVGVSAFSDYPEEAKSKPLVGDSWSPSIETVVELDPDLVLTVESVQLNSELDALGYTYLILAPADFDGIITNVRLVGEVTGKTSEGEQLASDMEKVVADITGRVEDASRPKVYFIIDASLDPNMPYTAGPGSFIDDIINLAGGENIAARAATEWALMSIEEVVDADPDIIVIMTMTGGVPTITAEEMEGHIIWQQLSAVQQGKIYIIDGDLVSRPGPRIVQGLEEMARIIHPELFD
jgi:iron complex transport system substrate-binding protein